MLKGFKDFILKGNVIDLATAVIIGTAFTAIVTAFTDGIVQPIINTIPWSPDQAAGLGFNIISDKPSTFVNLGSVITATINFLIIAAVVYFIIILPYNKLASLAGFGGEKELVATEVDLLTEIRDLLDPDAAEKAAAAKAAADEEAAAAKATAAFDKPSGPPPAVAPLPETTRISTPPP
ncbi:large conductance mechanosensitive channel protein MscL, partial [Gordonia desulfuricans]|nr:large conductance mechanosensitive channel protein MscL [Gordonia desulfuricans]